MGTQCSVEFPHNLFFQSNYSFPQSVFLPVRNLQRRRVDPSLVNRRIPIMAIATTIQATTRAQQGFKACSNPSVVVLVAHTTPIHKEETSEGNLMEGSTVEDPEGIGHTEEAAQGEATIWGG